MKIRDIPQKGRRGRIVASRNRFGQYHREEGAHKNRHTPAQERARGSLTWFVRLYNEISEERREGWRRLAQEVESRPWQGESSPLDGPSVFRKLNTVLELCGRAPLLDAPPKPQFGPNPVGALRISRVGNAFSLKLELSDEPRPASEDLMVYGWPPCNPAVEKASNYVFLGLLPPPEDGESDITDLFLNKLKEWRQLKDRRYQVPLPGAKIFIRAWQQVNGWENVAFARKTFAFVPARGGITGGALGRQH